MCSEFTYTVMMGYRPSGRHNSVTRYCFNMMVSRHRVVKSSPIKTEIEIDTATGIVRLRHSAADQIIFDVKF